MKKLTKKAIVMIVIELICLVGLGVYLTSMQNYLSLKQQRRDTEQKITQIRELVQSTGESSQRLKQTVDGIYQSKAMSLAYMVREKVDPELDDDVMLGYRELLGVDNVFILDMDGNILYKARPAGTDFTRARYNQLRTVFGADEPSQAFEVDTGDSQLRYYGAMIDRGHMAVVAQDPAELDRLTEETSSWKSVLENVSVGLDGYSFVISAKDYTFLYHPDEALIGLDALDAGIRVEDLEDGGCCWMTINGEELYCGVVKADDVYVLCAVTRGEINSANAITVIIVLFVFFTVITVVVFYAIVMLREEQTRDKAAAEEQRAEDYKDAGAFRWHRRVGRKLVTVSAVGLICILVISYYMQTLYCMSRASLQNTQRLEEVEMTMGRYQANVDMLTDQYNNSYVSKGETAAYILSQRPDIFQDRERLAELSRAIGAEYLFVFDDQGKIVATDSPYTNFTLSEDPTEQSYEFRQLLQGVPYLVQPAQKDDVGVYRQYVGVTIRDEDGRANGFVQVSVQPELLANAVEQLSLSAVLQNIRVGVNGFAFAVDRDTKNFIYYPEERYIGRSAADYGMGEDMFRDGDSGYLTLGMDKYYGAAIETDGAFVYVVIPAGELFGDRVLLSLSTTGVSLVCLALMCLLLSLERRRDDKSEQTGEETPAGPDGPIPPAAGGKRARMVDVVMPDGTVKKTESAFSRWSNQALGWGEMTAEQKTMMVLKVLLGLLALFIVVAVANKEAAFTRTSVFRYVLDGTWTKGVNVFAVTASVMILCVVSVVSMLLRTILKFLSRSMGARGETVIRLVNNLVKYVAVIVALYFCFAMFGVDTATLLASAGILSLVIGLGAQDLVKDIVAGLFIIFEGEFRVGDIVTIGDWRGTVVEIGVRTTKIEEPGKNIKIINNSAISNVINMTRKESFAACDVGIEYGESLERVEAILAEELPHVRERLPKITDGPFYKGVSELADSGVIIKIVAQCAEGDRIQMGRDLNREMKLIFDRYKINVPFPQVVLNQPVEFKEATEWQKRRAEQFAEEQRALAEDLETTVQS